MKFAVQPHSHEVMFVQPAEPRENIPYGNCALWPLLEGIVVFFFLVYTEHSIHSKIIKYIHDGKNCI